MRLPVSLIMFFVGVTGVTGAKIYRGIAMNEAEQKYFDGRKLMASGQTAAARDAFAAAGLSGYDKTSSLTGMVQCDFILSDDVELRADAAALHRLPGGKGEAMFWMGQMYRRNKEFAKAQQYLDLAISDGHPTAVHSLAAMRREMK